jgi:hypothetical protein
MIFNGAQFHLLINHAPVVAYPIISFALLWAWIRKEDAVFFFGCYLAVGTAFATLIAYLTGDGAEEVLKDLPGFDENLIHSHEDVAFIALLVGVLAGLIAVLILPVVRNRVKFLMTTSIQKKLRLALVLFSILLSGLLTVAAHRGGLIRHTEIRAN